MNSTTLVSSKHCELIKILENLIAVIKEMRKQSKDFVLIQNETEAKEWLCFLKNHINKEELKTLENEIADRCFYKFDVQIRDADLETDKKRLLLILIIAIIGSIIGKN